MSMAHRMLQLKHQPPTAHSARRIVRHTQNTVLPASTAVITAVQASAAVTTTSAHISVVAFPPRGVDSALGIVEPVS